MHLEHNPLVVPILELLREREGAQSEYELITRLRPQLEQVPELVESSQLALFRTHFLVMNALYQLQRDLLDEGIYLSISPLAIAMEPAQRVPGDALRDGSDRPLSEYYLNLANLRDTGSDDVERLLNSFWQRYIAGDRRVEALVVLDLPADADWPRIQRRYRRLAGQLHPDRGGDRQQFIRVREAYELLRRVAGR